MSKAKTACAPQSKDAELVVACMTYARAVVSQPILFDVDPDDSKTAQALVHRFFQKAERALSDIGETVSASAMGVCAKARVVPFILQDNDDIPPLVAAFLKSFAADVKDLADGLLYAERVSARKAVQS